MSLHVPILVFTDLDGTLIDHETYRWQAARPALRALKRIGAGVVLASSKTAPEITALQVELGLTQWPAIVENGAGLLSSEPKFDRIESDYEKLRAVLDRVPQRLRQYFQGFADMGVQGISGCTGLDMQAAQRAAQRSYSEPGLWTGPEAERAQFLQHIKENGVFAREGGRFLTLSFGATKADRVAQIIKQYQPQYTVALGDAPNDVEMLEAADFGVIVANPHRTPLPPMQGEREGKISRSSFAGPEGWNAAILDLLMRLELE